jgi:hypothetical protein
MAFRLTRIGQIAAPTVRVLFMRHARREVDEALTTWIGKSWGIWAGGGVETLGYLRALPPPFAGQGQPTPARWTAQDGRCGPVLVCPIRAQTPRK